MDCFQTSHRALFTDELFTKTLEPVINEAQVSGLNGKSVTYYVSSDPGNDKF